MRLQQENRWQQGTARTSWWQPILLLSWLLEKGLSLGKRSWRRVLRLHPDGLRWGVRAMMLLLRAAITEKNKAATQPAGLGRAVET